MIARGTSIIAAVAQNPGGPSGNLSTLVPLGYLDGEQAFEEDFPNFGLIFWYMSRKEVLASFTPGTLVIASIESAVVADSVPPIDRHQYRVESDSVREPLPTEVIEILDYDSRRITHPRELLLANDLIVSHRPLHLVYVRTTEAVYGPFATDSRLVDASSNLYTVVLRSPEDRVGYLELQTLESIADSNLTLDIDATVSLRSTPPHKSQRVAKCSYQLVCAAGIQTLVEIEKQYVVVKTPDQILRPLTRKYIERNKYQPVEGLFDEFVNYLGSEREGLTLTQTEVIEAIQLSLDRDRRLLRDLTEGLLSSGLLDANIEERIKARTDQYITDNTAEIAAAIRERTRELQLEVEALEKNKLALEADLSARSRQAAQQIELDRTSFTAECASERQKIRSEHEELSAKRNELTIYLEDLTTRYSRSRDEVLKDYLALLPLLEKSNIIRAGQNDEQKVAGSEGLRKFAIPAFCIATTGEYEPVRETDFFQRFTSHVASRGFSYREVDLISFHLNFKTSEFFVLGGVSGTGKSSLPRLYAEALAGDSEESLQRFSRIAVNPTWLEVSDLLGRVNVLDKTFNPSETGLFRQLIFAETEHKEKGAEAGLWPIILDEMNLAQAEHYFGPFLQVLGLPESRTVSVFDPAVVDSSDPFRPWAILRLPPIVRFIGTVNFDETTKQLSARLLDRGPLARIDIASQPTTMAGKRASGAPILYRHFQDWSTSSEINRNASKLLDEINPHLRQLGCPLNPRRRKAIDAFLANTSPEICSPEVALDIAISQRILSMVRGLFRESARDAFEKLRKVILDANPHLPECERVVTEIAEREYNLLLAS